MKYIDMRIGVICIVAAIYLFAANKWQVIGTAPGFDRYIDKVNFYDDMTGWACAYFEGVLKTEDGGNTWRRLESHYKSEPIFAVWFVSRSKGWAVAPYIGNERARSVNILSTQDGGVSWQRTRQFNGKHALFDIYFKDTQHGWAVGVTEHGEGLIIGTSDGGEKWNIQMQGSEPCQLRSIRFADIYNGWAIGSGGLVHTSNGGRTWKLHGFAHYPLLRGLCVLDSKNIWISGGPGVLYRTTDGGESWSKPALPLENSKSILCRVNFIDKNRGLVSGYEGLILSTKDGGLSWIREQSPTTSVLDEITITSSRIFVPIDRGCILTGMVQ